MGRCDSYFFGECTWGCCTLNGWVGDGWGNAWQWLGRAQDAGFNTTMVPTVGAVVIYGQGGGYSDFGHCATVIDAGGGDQFQVREMNYVGWNTWDDRWSGMWDVSGFILPPGVSAGPSGPPGPGRGGPGVANVAQEWWQLQDVANSIGPERTDRRDTLETWASQIG